MRLALLCKRRYTNRDLLDDRFGRLYHLPVELGRRGHDVSVVTLDYRLRGTRQRLEAAGVIFTGLPVAGPGKLGKTLVELRRWLRERDPEVIVASGDIYVGALAALLAGHRPWLFDIYDDYRHFGASKIPGGRALFSRLVADAEHVLVASRPLASDLNSKARGITVVENGYDPNVFRPRNRMEVRRDLGIPPSDKVIGYFGTLSEERGICVLLEAFDKLRSGGAPRPLRLLLAGQAPPKVQLERPGIDYRGLVSQETVARLISASDVVTIPYVKTDLIDATNACKIAEYLACEVPVVATRISDMEEIFAGAPLSLAAAGNSEDLARAIHRQLLEQRVAPSPRELTWGELAKKLERALAQTLD